MSWTVVYTSTQPHIIEIVKNILSDNEIRFVTVDRRDSMYTSVSEPCIEVYIPSEDFMLTKSILDRIGA